GVNGQVKLAQLSKSANGTFELEVKIQGKLGPGEQPLVLVVPPNPGSGATAVLTVNGGAEYCIPFGGAAGGQITDKGATSFKVTKPTAQVCSTGDWPQPGAVDAERVDGRVQVAARYLEGGAPQRNNLRATRADNPRETQGDKMTARNLLWLVLGVVGVPLLIEGN